MEVLDRLGFYSVEGHRAHGVPGEGATERFAGRLEKDP